MWRWLSYSFSVLCLLLVIATAILWVRSYWTSDELDYVSAGREPMRHFTLLTTLGVFEIDVEVAYTSLPTDPGLHFHTRPIAGLQRRQRLHNLFPLDFHWFRAPPNGPTLWMIIFPMWAIAALLLVALLICLPPQLLRWRRARRRRRGLCEKCGYDLRASPERCPECGTPVLRSPTSTAGEAPAATPVADAQRE